MDAPATLTAASDDTSLLPTSERGGRDARKQRGTRRVPRMRILRVLLPSIVTCRLIESLRPTKQNREVDGLNVGVR